jgi:hypothetical protein
MRTSPPTSAGCKCQDWCRSGSKYWTDHHERCENHIPGTILVWKVIADGSHYYEHNLMHAVEMKEEGCEIEGVVVPASEYEGLSEFAGF